LARISELILIGWTLNLVGVSYGDLLRRNGEYSLGWFARYKARLVADQLLSALITDFLFKRDTRCGERFLQRDMCF